MSNVCLIACMSFYLYLKMTSWLSVRPSGWMSTLYACSAWLLMDNRASTMCEGKPESLSNNWLMYLKINNHRKLLLLFFFYRSRQIKLARLKTINNCSKYSYNNIFLIKCLLIFYKEGVGGGEAFRTSLY